MALERPADARAKWKAALEAGGDADRLEPKISAE